MGLPTTLEIERLMNLIRGFGWEKIKEELPGDKIIVTIQKKIEVSAPPKPP